MHAVISPPRCQEFNFTQLTSARDKWSINNVIHMERKEKKGWLGRGGVSLCRFFLRNQQLMWKHPLITTVTFGLNIPLPGFPVSNLRKNWIFDKDDEKKKKRGEEKILAFFKQGRFISIQDSGVKAEGVSKLRPLPPPDPQGHLTQSAPVLGQCRRVFATAAVA